jgi:hypothetical protein
MFFKFDEYRYGAGNGNTVAMYQAPVRHEKISHSQHSCRPQTIPLNVIFLNFPCYLRWLEGGRALTSGDEVWLSPEVQLFADAKVRNLEEAGPVQQQVPRLDILVDDAL